MSDGDVGRADEELRSVAPAVAVRLPALVRRTRERLVAELESYAALDRTQLTSSITDQFEYLLALISGTTPRGDGRGPQQMGRLRAEQGVPLHEVLEAYRITVAELWQDVQEAALSHGTDPRLVVQLAGEMFGRLEEVSRIAILNHRDRAAELLVDSEAERAATLEALFTGYLRGHDEIWRAAARLELPYDGRFVAVVAEAKGVADPLPDVAGRLRRQQLGSTWRMTPDLKIGLVSLGECAEEALLDLLTPLAVRRVGLSTVFESPSQTSQGVALARLTMGGLPAGSSGVARLAQSPLIALLAASPETARTLVRAVLGGILVLPAKSRAPLLETLTAWLAAKGSVGETAAALYCHPNTVRYRLNRVAEVLGVDLADPAALGQVSAAVQALRLFPLSDAP